ALDPEPLPEPELEQPDLLRVVPADVDEQDLGRTHDSGLLVDVPPPAVDDPDVERLLDLPEPGGQRRAVERVETAVKHLALRPEPLLAALVARPERSDQDVPRDLAEVDRAG